MIYYQPVYGGAADAFLAWKDGVVIGPGMDVAPVANPWRIDRSSMDFLMQMVQSFTLSVCFDSRAAMGRILRRSGIVAKTTREVLTYRSIVSLLVRLTNSV